jgi:hypothetical protein
MLTDKTQDSQQFGMTGMATGEDDKDGPGQGKVLPSPMPRVLVSRTTVQQK